MATAEERLRQYANDRAAAEQEIQRAKQVYQQEASNWSGEGQFSSSDRAREISGWADKVRQASGISNDNPALGNNPNTFGQSQNGSQPEQPNYTAMINQIYDQQRNAQLNQLRSSRDKAVGELNQQRTNLAPAYQQKRNQADVVNQQNVQRLRELMAANGLTQSGENVSANVALSSQRLNSLNQLNLQQQQAYNDIDRRISNLNDPANEQALMAALEAERSKALLGQMNANRQFGLQEAGLTGQYNGGLTLAAQGQLFNQNMTQNQFNYQQQRDQVGDQRYEQQFEYQKARDAIADERYRAEFDEDVKRWGLEFAFNKAVQNRQLDISAMNAQTSRFSAETSRMNANRLASGGTRNSGNSNAPQGNDGPVRTMSKKDSYNNGINYWNQKISNMDNFPGVYRIEQAILNNPEAQQELINQGYDLGSAIDALYYVGTNGQFRTKTDYERWYNEQYGG